MFLIQAREKRNNDRKRCRSVAAFLVLIVTLLSVSFLIPQCYAAEEGSDRAPYVVDWGLFDEETGTQTSMMKSGVIEGDLSGVVFYIKFNHNVAQRDESNNVADLNCSLISVVSNGGRPVASTAWVKDTQLEFQYRQCIFITVTGQFDPSKYYHIAIAPGITAKNGFSNRGGTDLYFSFPTSGAGDEPTPIEDIETDAENETGDSAEEKTPAKESEKPNASGDKAESEGSGNTVAEKPNKSDTSGSDAGSGRSQGLHSQKKTPQATGSIADGNSIQTPSPQEAKARYEIYRINASVFENAEETGAEEQKSDEFSGTKETDTRNMVAFSVMIALCIMMIAAGALCETLSFRYRLRHR